MIAFPWPPAPLGIRLDLFQREARALVKGGGGVGTELRHALPQALDAA